MIFLVFEATTAGTSVLCSQFLGARQMDNVFRAIGVSLAFNMMMGVIVSAALFFGAERILRLMERICASWAGSRSFRPSR